MAWDHPPGWTRAGAPFRGVRVVEALLLASLTLASLPLLGSGDWRWSRAEVPPAQRERCNADALPLQVSVLTHLHTPAVNLGGCQESLRVATRRK